ncbi:EamA family transporter [Bacillus massilinigeriensis]|uniref:EamA family transporter n=1 Tax=Bacillus mediterraneensis TaxID=1805474 RepID=UPI0008F86C0A|nr:DMT family transporter [Bacillus mediterraneensis]
MKTWKYPFLVLLGGFSYGLLSAIVKLGLHNGFSIEALVGGQYIFGWLGLMLLALFFSKKKITKKNFFKLLIAGTTMSMTGIFYGFAVEELSASIAVLLLFQFAWIGVVIEAIANRTFPSREKLISVFILFIGTLLAGGISGGMAENFNMKGTIFGLLAALSFSLYVFVSSRIATEVPPYLKGFVMATGAVIIISLAFPPTFIVDGSMQAGLWNFILFLALFGIVVPNICFTIGAPKVGPGLGTILGAIELPTAMIASIVLLREVVSPMQWVGVALILAGIILPQVLMARKMARRGQTKEA